MSEDGIREHCQTCAVVAQCKATFGDYWTDKSGGGVGCAYRFPGYAGAEARHPEAQEAAHARPGEAKQDELKLAQGTTTLRREDVPRREPWEIAHTTRGRSAGIYCMNKRHGMARQGRLI